jgi:hypothetical protein
MKPQKKMNLHAIIFFDCRENITILFNVPPSPAEVQIEARVSWASAGAAHFGPVTGYMKIKHGWASAGAAHFGSVTGYMKIKHGWASAGAAHFGYD